jgi:6-phosphogluconolactonase/glucosamine-6-phosphate isomerase/deaminase
MNGHIALNEPGTPWDIRCHVSNLAPLTIAVGQKYFESETPLEKGMTLGLAYLAEARQTVLMASGDSKAAIVRDALYGPIGPALPASIFQTLPHAQVMLDQPAAAAC